MKLPFSVISRIFDYFTNNSTAERSTVICYCANTGAPQGTVLAPFLFSMYIADCRSTDESCPVVKFADDRELVGNVNNDEDAPYHKQTENFVNWCFLN